MKPIKNRMTGLLGVEYPIIQAPMGWIARAQLASAVSNAGGLGIIETSSGQLDEVRAEIIKMRERLARIIATQTGQKIEQVRVDIERDNWMTAKEAISYGICNKMIASVSELV